MSVAAITKKLFSISVGEKALLYIERFLYSMLYMSSQTSFAITLITGEYGISFLIFLAATDPPPTIRQFLFFIPILYIFSASFGLFGIEATQAAADVVTFILSLIIGIDIMKKMK